MKVAKEGRWPWVAVRSPGRVHGSRCCGDDPVKLACARAAMLLSPRCQWETVLAEYNLNAVPRGCVTWQSLGTRGSTLDGQGKGA